MSKSKLRALTWIAIPLAVVLLSSCAASETSDDGTDGSTIRVVGANEPVTINPVYGSVSDAKSWGAMYDALVGNDPSTNETNQDGLLYGWERPTDTTWTFKVREGVTFHNGEVFDAAAAAFMMLTERDDPKSNLGLFYKMIEDAKPNGDLLEVTTVSPYPVLPGLLASTMAVAPGAYKELGGEGFAEAPVGTGPYKFQSYQRGGTLVLEANEDYWQGTPGADRLELSWSADPQTRASLVQTGQADLALDLTPQALAVLPESDGVTIERGPIDARYYIYLDMRQGVFADPDLRRAAALAIDRESIVSGIFKEGGAAVNRHFTGDLYATPPVYENAIEYNPAEAKEILKGKGSPTVTLTYADGRSPNDLQIGTAVAGMWEAVGFTVKNNPLDFATFLEQRGGGLEATGSQLITTIPQPDGEFRAWVGSESIAKNCEPAWYDEKSAEALALTDPSAQQKVYDEMEDRLLNKDVCFIPIVKYEGIWAMDSDLDGFRPPRLGTPDYSKLTLR